MVYFPKSDKNFVLFETKLWETLERSAACVGLSENCNAMLERKLDTEVS